ncbi:MAG: serine hydrolase [Nitrospirae bacterium]|nr:serine hydrolase [Nitrospirota bacterium]
MQGFRFTSPLLDVEMPEGVAIGHEPIPFKYKVREFVQKQLDTRQVIKLGVYYRDLHDGPWFGINAKTPFNPASLMKLPIMIAWLKRAERDPRELARTFLYDGVKDLSEIQSFSPELKLVSGRSYTVEQLLYHMMMYSDNNAMSMLFSKLGVVELDTVLNSMDINRNPNNPNDSITLHGYSGYFRILYNASFLNREMSEKALEILSLQDFPQGIIAGVPKGTIVASKFGEHGEDSQLHEFGIVYHRTHPYILGIMTQGDDFGKQAEIIRDISRMIYAEVDAGAYIGQDAGVEGPP